MLATTLAIALAVLTAAIVAESVTRGELYKSVSYKGIKPRDELHNEMRFSIPDGQCSGAIDRKLLCQHAPTFAVEVTAIDRKPYPMIHIDSQFGFAEVQRVPNNEGLCVGSCAVTVRKACGLFSAVRRRRDLLPQELPPVHLT